MSDQVILTTVRDGDTFTFGETIHGRLDERGRFVPVATNWRTRIAVTLARCLWPPASMTVTHIDRESGTVTVR